MKNKFMILIGALSISATSFAAEDSQLVCLDNDMTRCTVVIGGGLATSILAITADQKASQARSDFDHELRRSAQQITENERYIFDSIESRPRPIDAEAFKKISPLISSGDQITITYLLSLEESRAVRLQQLEDIIDMAKKDKIEKQALLGEASGSKAEKLITQIDSLDEHIEKVKYEIRLTKAGRSGNESTRVKSVKVFNGSNVDSIEKFLAKNNTSGGQIASITKVNSKFAQNFQKAVIRKNLFHQGKLRSARGGTIAIALAAALTLEEATLGLVSNQISQPSKSKLEMKTYSAGSK